MYEFCNTMDGYAWEIPDFRLFEYLETLRCYVGAITITSGYRTEAFNRKVDGHVASHHLKGLAVDVRFYFRYTELELIALCKMIGFRNIGFYYKNGKLDRMHLDIGDTWNGKAHYIFRKYL